MKRVRSILIVVIFIMLAGGVWFIFLGLTRQDCATVSPYKWNDMCVHRAVAMVASGDREAARSLLDATPSWLADDTEIARWRISWAERLLAAHNVEAFGAALGYCGRSDELSRQKFSDEAKLLAAGDTAQQSRFERMILEACR